MKKRINPFLFLLLLGFFLIKSQIVFSQVGYSAYLLNDAKISDTEYQFDVYLQSTGISPFILTSFQLGILINPAMDNGLIMGVQVVPGSSDLIPAQDASLSVAQFDSLRHIIKVLPQLPNLAGTTISSTYPGTRLCRLQISNVIPFGIGSPNLVWNFAGVPFYPTIISANIGGIATNITNAANHSAILTNPSYSNVTSLPTANYWTPSLNPPAGWTYSALGTPYTAGSNFTVPTASNAGKFDNTGDYVLVHFNEPPLLLSYYLKGFGSGTAPTSGTFLVEESIDGISFTTLNTVVNKENSWTPYSQTLSPASRYVRFIYSSKTSGNIGIDNVDISALAAHPTVFNLTGGGNYCFDEDPGSINTITLSGSDDWGGITYQLLKNGNPEGTTVSGTGNPIVWTGLTPGIYTVVATNQYGQETMNGTVNIIESHIVPNFETVNPSCFGYSNGAINLSVSGGVMPYTYFWMGLEAITEDVENLTAGSYFVIVEDALGCSDAFGPIELTQPELFSLGVEDIFHVSCFGAQNGGAIVFANNGVAPISYLWNNDQQGSMLTGVNGGSYSVVATDANGCTSNRQVVIYEAEMLNVSLISSNISCYGTCDAFLEAHVSGGIMPYTILWNTNQAGDFLMEQCAGSYAVTVTDYNLCEVQASLIVGQPSELLASGTPEILASGYNTSAWGVADGVVTLNISGGTPYNNNPSQYLVNYGAGQVLMANGQQINNLAVGNYTVTVSDFVGCETTFSLNILQPPPPVLTVTGSVDNVLCKTACNGAIDLSFEGGLAPYTLFWSNGSTIPDQVGLCAGTYTVTVFDSTGDPVYPFTWNYVQSNETHNILVVLNGASVNGLPLEIGDYIGVFYNRDGSLYCGGYNQITGQENLFSYVTAFGDDTFSPLKDGFVSGESFTYKVWKSATGSSVDVTPVYASELMGLPFDISGTFGSNGMSAIETLTGSQSIIPQPADFVVETFTVTEPDPLVITATPVNVSCHGGSNGAIDIVATGGSNHIVTYVFPGSVTEIEPSSQVIACFNFCQSCIGWCYQMIYPNGTLGPCVCIRNYTGSNYNQVERVNLPAGDYTVFAYDTINGCSALVPVVITEPEPLVITATPTNVSCNGGSNGAIDIVATGGSEHLVTFVFPGSVTEIEPSSQVIACFNFCQSCIGWCYQMLYPNGTLGPCVCIRDYTGSNYNQVERVNLPAGNYTVFAYDTINGCSAFVPVVITEPEPIVITATPTNVSCHGGSNGAIDIVATGGSNHIVTYVFPGSVTDIEPSSQVIACFNFCQSCNGWCYQMLYPNGTLGPCVCISNYTGSNYNQVERVNLPAGNYTVFAYDTINGCSAFVPVVITEPQILNASTNFAPISCNGGNTTISVTANGGTSPYTGTGSFEVSAGTYSYTITDAGNCTDVVDVTVTEPDVLIASAQSTSIMCNGGTSVVTVSATGGTQPYSGVGNFEVTSGTYNYIVTDANGCQSSVEVIVSEPAALLASVFATPILCNGGISVVSVSATGGTEPYTGLGNFDVTSGSYIYVIVDGNNCQTSVEITVTEPEVLMAYAMATPILCNGGMSFVTVSAMGGTEPYMGTGNFEVSAGTYLYNVVDVNGCQAVVEVIVAEPEVLLAFAQAAPIICNGGITDVSVSATGGTLPYFGTGAFEVSAGTYSYTVTDANNCSDVVEIVVNQPDELTISVDFNPILCNGDLTNLYVNYQGGTGQVSFEWSTGVTGSQLLNVIAGLYYVTATDAFGCQTILEVSVLEQTSLNLVLNMNTVSCFGAANGTVISNVSGGIPSYSYLWNTGATSPNIVGLAPGFYSLTVIDANQCSVSGQVQVTQPLPLFATAIKNNVTCFGASTGSINLTMGGGTLPYSFLWNNQATTEDLNDLPAGNYSVIITDASGCVYNYSTTIIQPSNVSITVNTIPASCFGTATGSVDISVSGATPPYSYFWNTFAVSQDIVSVLAGTYQVSVTDANQCQFVAVGIVSEPVALALNLTATNTSAPGISDGSVDLSVSGGTLPYSYLWNNGTINQDLAGVPAGIYDVTVTDSNGCMEFGSAEVEETPLLPASWNITPSAIIHQIDIPLSALISWYGQPLVYGDYIGVFFNHGAGEVCGGYAKWEGLATTLNAFGDPSGLNGFLEGDQFSWKIWVQSSLTDHDASATYTPVGGAITHTGIFANGGYSQLASLYAYQTQNISVKNNWYISTYLMPVNTNMVSIFAPIASSVQLVKDENGKVYWISYGVNQIGAWLKNKAYQVKLITPSATINLQITGIPIIPQNELISLKSGWNYLGYTRQSNGAIASMLSPISGQIVQVKNSLGQIYLPSNVFNPYPFNSIGNMIPGQGYYIKMGSLSSFSYPANSSYALPAKLLEVSSVHFKDIMNTGQNMVLGIPESAWSEMPSLNDEIGVFNAKDELVGSSVYTGGLTMITIWGEGSLASEKRGMAEGEELTLKVWNSTDFSENLLTVSAFVDGDGKYHTDVVYFVDKLQKIDNLASASIILGQNYPNPFNGSTEIAFSLPEEANVNIEVYNAMGELIETHKLGNVLAGSHQFILDAADYSSGSYFYVLNAGGLRQTRSMNIIK